MVKKNKILPGFTLIEVMMSMGLASGLLLILGVLSTNSLIMNQTVTDKSAATVFWNQVSAVLSSQNACSAIFACQNLSTINTIFSNSGIQFYSNYTATTPTTAAPNCVPPTPGSPPPPTIVPPIGQSTAGGQITISSMTLSPLATTVNVPPANTWSSNPYLLTIQITMANPNRAAVQNPLTYKQNFYINLLIDSNQTFYNCGAQSNIASTMVLNTAQTSLTGTSCASNGGGATTYNKIGAYFYGTDNFWHALWQYCPSPGVPMPDGSCCPSANQVALDATSNPTCCTGSTPIASNGKCCAVGQTNITGYGCCPDNQVLNATTCCSTGTVPSNGNCCAPSTYGVGSQCCTVTQIYNGTCTGLVNCIGGNIMDNGSCCPAGQQFAGGSTCCAVGKIASNGQCCSAGQSFIVPTNGNQGMCCNDYDIATDGSCCPGPSSQTNLIQVNGKCVQTKDVMADGWVCQGTVFNNNGAPACCPLGKSLTAAGLCCMGTVSGNSCCVSRIVAGGECCDENGAQGYCQCPMDNPKPTSDPSSCSKIETGGYHGMGMISYDCSYFSQCKDPGLYPFP